MESFYLAGHSFGGYIAGLYCCAYPARVKKLLLCSPIGIRNPPLGETWESRFEGNKESGRGPPGYVKPLMGWFWKQKFSPFGPGRFMGQRQQIKLLNLYVKSKVKIEDEDEAYAIINFMY
mgnify:FL=1